MKRNRSISLPAPKVSTLASKFRTDPFVEITLAALQEHRREVSPKTGATQSDLPLTGRSLEQCTSDPDRILNWDWPSLCSSRSVRPSRRISRRSNVNVVQNIPSNVFKFLIKFTRGSHHASNIRWTSFERKMVSRAREEIVVHLRCSFSEYQQTRSRRSYPWASPRLEWRITNNERIAQEKPSGKIDSRTSDVQSRFPTEMRSSGSFSSLVDLGSQWFRRCCYSRLSSGGRWKHHGDQPRRRVEVTVEFESLRLRHQLSLGFTCISGTTCSSVLVSMWKNTTRTSAVMLLLIQRRPTICRVFERSIHSI